MIEFNKTIRGINVTVYADNFWSDESVGIGLNPDVLYALDINGNDFELTDEEINDLSIESANIYDDMIDRG